MRYSNILFFIFVNIFFATFFSGCLMLKEEGDLMEQDLVKVKEELKIVHDELLRSKDKFGNKIEELDQTLTRARKATAYTTANDHVELDRIQRDILMLTGMVEKAGFDHDMHRQEVLKRLEEITHRLSVVETKLGIDPKKYQTQNGNGQSSITVKEQPKQSGKKPDPKPDVKEIYKSAVKLIRDGKTVEGRRLMALFLKEYKKGSLLDDAQYWIGESYYKEKNYHQAVMEYQKISDKYPKGDQVDNSLFMLGECLRRLGMKDDAKLFYKELIERFPKSSLSTKAKSILKKL